jgi:aminoglycoside phosphotransferase (APT) family kinase protein
MPDGLEARSVIDGLRDGWDFDVDGAEYAAVGGGSYHWVVADETGLRCFVTVDDLDQKAWLGPTRAAAFDGLRRAFDTSVALRDAGLPFVVAPIPTRQGGSLRRLGSRYAIALFPFVEGEAGEFGYYENDEDGRRAVVAMLAELHEATAAAGSAVRTVGFDLPGRDHLEVALLDLDEAWTGGPLSEPAREAVRDSASVIAELLALADRLAADAQTRGGGWVVTHGEPHAANVMRAGKGRFLVDWDTVALAPPERDLWMPVVGGADAAARYLRATGTQVDEAALDFFRLTWDLKDLAEYLNVLRSPHQENDDTVRHYQALKNSAAIRESWTALLD